MPRDCKSDCSRGFKRATARSSRSEVGSRKLNHFLSLSSEALVREISRLGHSLSRNETWASRYVKITLFDLSENPSRLNQSHGLLDAIVVHDTLPSRSIA